MPYQTGTASGVNDLLDKLRIFALANGWALDFSGARSDALGNAVLLNKGGLCVALLSNTVSAGSQSDPPNFFDVYTYPGPYSGASPNTDQPGRSDYCVANGLAGAFTAYHFFAASNYLHIVVEVVPGRFSHFGAGTLDKAGGGSAVAYCYGLRWEHSQVFTNGIFYHSIPFDVNAFGFSGGSIRADADGVSPRNYSMRTSGPSRAVGGFLDQTFGLANHMMRVGPSALTGRAVLAPAIVMVERTTNVFSIAGAPLDFRFVRMDNITPGDVITIGSDQWKCFPIIRKNGPPGVENSGPYGYAYRIT